jgi:hypothetical protein
MRVFVVRTGKNGIDLGWQTPIRSARWGMEQREKAYEAEHG